MQIRPIKIHRNFTKHAEGSVLVEFGETKVLCTASIEEGVPNFLKGSNQGWITAEYSMLPRATHQRSLREANKGKQSGRTLEIQRLIGRSLRACINLEEIDKHSIILDCDVIQADGSTRCAAISGACVALIDSLKFLQAQGKISTLPKVNLVAGISVGFVKGELKCDLCYADDCRADVDLNLIFLENGNLVEIQGTAERKSFSPNELNQMLEVGTKAVEQIFIAQRQALGII